MEGTSEAVEARRTSGPGSPGSIPTSRFWPGAARDEGRDQGRPARPKAGKDGKGGAVGLWTGAGRAIAAKARSAWRSVAVPKPVPGAPAFPPPQLEANISSKLGSRSGQSGQRWHAVWCHERCHKTDAATLRAQLQLVISRYNGELICQKTAGKFKLWLDQERDEGPKGFTAATSPSSPSSSFYVLISDWRQLKPCMDILQEEGADQPAAVILLCEQSKGFVKAQIRNDARPPTPFPLYFLQLQEDQWVAQLEEIISVAASAASPSVHQSTGLTQAFHLPRGSAGPSAGAAAASTFYAPAPLSPTRFSL